MESTRPLFLALATAGSFAAEPTTAPHPFHRELRITLSPHVGGITADAYVKTGARLRGPLEHAGFLRTL